MNRTNLLAIILSIFAILISYWFSDSVYEQIPHVEDEFAYIWQAQVFANRQMYLQSPPHADQLAVPFIIDYNGIRFSKYPPGWSLLLSFGVLTNLTAWINPILAGLAIWLTFRLGQKIFNENIALLASFLLLTSPFFLLNSSALLSHPFSLVLTLTLILSWFDLFLIKEKDTTPDWIKMFIAGGSIGLLAITRPLTGIAVALPFFIHGIHLIIYQNTKIKIKVFIIGIMAACISSLLFLWQYILTGDATQNLYELYWAYDQIGFGKDVGTQTGGHNFFWVINNLVLSIIAGNFDLFGWGYFSWLFIPFGLLASRKNKCIEILLGIPAGLAIAYAFYWISQDFYGPRYYYESIIILCLLTSAGIFWIDTWIKSNSTHFLMKHSASFLTVMLVAYNFIFYLPDRMLSMQNFYSINKNQQTPFLTNEAQSLTPAIVIVHTQQWTDCAGLLPLQDPWLTSPFIFACYNAHTADLNQQNEFPNRKILHYYPNTMELLLNEKQP
jgi:4-amino-4-deoxy-L-arabinose transferase-like glycosyltransferase